ncbi:MAG: cytidylyltransferase domain-containing protein [Bacteroidota bacterium]
MINLQETLVIIPARKGSKGIPGKNKKILGGKPLIQYTIDITIALFPKEIICVSTDDEDIQLLAEKSGLKVPFLREEKYSGDNTSGREVMLYELSKQDRKINTIIYLQPTSPLRTIKNLEETIEQYHEEMDMLVSVVDSKVNPFYNLFFEDINGYLNPFSQNQVKIRQDSPKYYQFNGAIYIINSRSLMEKEISQFQKIKKYVMNPFQSIDIDTEFDWFVAEQLLKNMR